MRMVRMAHLDQAVSRGEPDISQIIFHNSGHRCGRQPLLHVDILEGLTLGIINTDTLLLGTDPDTAPAVFKERTNVGTTDRLAIFTAAGEIIELPASHHPVQPMQGANP